MDAALQKTKLCKFYSKGACTRGDDCTFAHSHRELHQQPDLFKTSLCATFVTNGTCHRAARCKFAHFEGELRDRPGHLGTMSSSSTGERMTATQSSQSMEAAPSHLPFAPQEHIARDLWAFTQREQPGHLESMSPSSTDERIIATRSSQSAAAAPSHLPLAPREWIAKELVPHTQREQPGHVESIFSSSTGTRITFVSVPGSRQLDLPQEQIAREGYFWTVQDAPDAITNRNTNTTTNDYGGEHKNHLTAGFHVDSVESLHL